MHHLLKLCVAKSEIVFEIQSIMLGPDERSDRAERGSKRGRTVILSFEWQGIFPGGKLH
jgi:hypothetical protein